MTLASLLTLAGCSGTSAPAVFPEEWDYRDTMREVAARHCGAGGIVLHVGDSNTLHPGYSQWALAGKDRTPEQAALLVWMHTGTGDDLDGWTLCRRITGRNPDRSATAANGMQLGQFVAGELAELPLAAVIRRYNPQIVVMLLGTNDATMRRPAEAFAADLRAAVEQLLHNGVIPVLTTIPPHLHRPEFVARYNVAIHALARAQQLPLIDFYGEIFRRAPENWAQSLLEADGLHLTASHAAGPMNPENLARSGQLLRVALTMQKLAEIKARVLD